MSEGEARQARGLGPWNQEQVGRTIGQIIGEIDAERLAANSTSGQELNAAMEQGRNRAREETRNAPVPEIPGQLVTLSQSSVWLDALRRRSPFGVTLAADAFFIRTASASESGEIGGRIQYSASSVLEPPKSPEPEIPPLRPVRRINLDD